jgi:hypothetical protein
MKFSLKNLLFEDDPKSKSESAPVSQPAQSQPQPIQQPVQPVSQGGVIDEGIQDQLLQVLEQNNTPEFDYFEFKDSLKNLQSVIPDEPSRFKAAFAAVQKLTSPDKLIATADMYLGKLAEKKDQFAQYVQQLMNQNVGSKEAQVQQLEEDMIKKQDTIDRLNQEISDAQTQKLNLLNEAAGEKSKIETVQRNFDVTYQAITNTISGDKQKIQVYLCSSTPKEAK